MNKNTQHFLDLLLLMTEREFRVSYKNTMFGFLWLVVNPVLQMLVVGFVFTYFVKEPIKHYYYYLFIGLLVWSFFSLCLIKCTPSIVFARSLIKKAAFPRAVVPLSIIFSNLFRFTAAFAIFLIPLFFLGTLTFMSIVYILAALLLLIVFTIGICFLTSSLNVRFRDINFFVQALLILWFYASPIVYTLSQMPDNLLWLWNFNPLVSILQLFQRGLLGNPIPNLSVLAYNVTIIIIVSAIGLFVFQKQSDTFDDWL